MPIQTDYVINGKKWTVTRDENFKVLDVGVELSRKEYLELKGKLHDPKSQFENSSSLDLLKNGFAKARGEAVLESYEHKNQGDNDSKRLEHFLNHLEDISTKHLKILEQSVNGSYGNPQQKIRELWKQTEEYERELSSFAKQMQQAFFDDSLSLPKEQRDFLLQDLEKLQTRLLANLNEFQNQLLFLRGLDITPEEIDQLLSAQDRGSIASLGGLIGQQTQAICDMAVETSTTLKNRYIKDLYQKNEVTTAFLETQAKLRLKNSSLYGVEFTDTKLADKESKDLPEKGYFSVIPYLEGNSVADLDKIVCLISGTPLSQRSLSHPPEKWLDFLNYSANRAFRFTMLYLTPIVDLVFLTIPHLLALPFVNTVYLNELHETYSPVIWAKKKWNEQYVRLDEKHQPLNNEHQELLNAYKNEESLSVSLFKTFTPDLISRVIRHTALNLRDNLSQRVSQFFKPKPQLTAEETFNQYVENYQLLKPILNNLKEQALLAEETQIDNGVKSFPMIARRRVNEIKSPARVVCDVMYIFDEHIVNHLAQTRPGPATFFFLMAAGTFGSGAGVFGALAWMHGLPSYMQAIPIAMSKSFTGYSGTMAGTHGLLAATLQFKFFTAGASILTSAFDKNNTILESMAANPEEIVAGFVAFVGIGYAIGYLPNIPLFPSNIPGLSLLNGYSEAINTIITEAADAREGLMPLTTIEYGFLGFKALLLIKSLGPDFEKKEDVDDLNAIINALKSNEILALPEEQQRNQIELLLKQSKNPLLHTEKAIESFVGLIKQTKEQLPGLHQRNHEILQKIKKEREEWDQIIEVSTQIAQKPQDNFKKLESVISMLTDPETPITFTPENRKEAIQFYNHLSQLFDTYNQEVKMGLHLGHQPIAKEDFLQAFRNQHIPSNENNLLRMLSFYPGYPLRFLWREAQLAFNSSPYTIDRIQAAREKDVLLRHQWTGLARNSMYALTNLINKSIKGIVGFLPAIAIVGEALIRNSSRAIINLFRETKLPIEWDTMSYRLQGLGRFLNRFAIQDSLAYVSQEALSIGDSIAREVGIEAEAPLAMKNLRARVGQAAHIASDFKDLTAAGIKIQARFDANIHNAEMLMAAENSRRVAYVERESVKKTEMTRTAEVNHTQEPKKSSIKVCQETVEEIKSIIDQQWASDTTIVNCRERLEKARENALKVETNPQTRGYLYTFFESAFNALKTCAQYVSPVKSSSTPKTMEEPGIELVDMNARDVSEKNESSKTGFENFVTHLEEALNDLIRSVCLVKSKMFKNALPQESKTLKLIDNVNKDDSQRLSSRM